MRNILLISILLILGCTSGNVLKVSGDSMAPAIKSGTIVSYTEEPFENLEVGDIIVFQDSGREGSPRVIRRVAGLNEDGSLQVRADARAEPDPVKVTKEMYIGKIEA